MAKKPEAVPVLTAADRPGDLLPVGEEPPVIASDDDADKALRELAFLHGHTKSVSAAVQTRIDQIVEESKRSLVVEGKTYEDREAELTAALESFTQKNHRELKDGSGARTVALQNGSIGWKKSRDAVGYVKGKTQKDALTAIDEATTKTKKEGGFKKRLSSLLESIRLFGSGEDTRFVSLFVTAKPSVNLTEARKAYEDEKIGDAQLSRYHMQFVAGSDSFVCEPDEFERR